MAESRVAVITGASRGIGLTTAKAFAAAGFSVVITGRDQKKLDDVRAQLGTDKTQALAFDVA
ncbi:MAG TPA: SDR family NAD(P)-dependent oxidoreductase, partial [Candidatus Limnocylindrales bacterium]|nr:SDR family NAD(P)-dependent oxidoreductase [Candidatus Limnocylindrales bacterium]